jgi:hypothetical protein
MKAPLAIIALSLFLGAAVTAPGSPLPGDLVFLAFICGLGGLLLLLLPGKRRPARTCIVLDGSNLLYWLDDQPNLAAVQVVVDQLCHHDLVPVIWFDANAGYLIGGRWMGPKELARLLRLDARQIFVAPKGTPADPLLLNSARKLGARVISNDRFRDWTESHPWLADPGFLIRGCIRDGAAELQLPAPAASSVPAAPPRHRERMAIRQDKPRRARSEA